MPTLAGSAWQCELCQAVYVVPALARACEAKHLEGR